MRTLTSILSLFILIAGTQGLRAQTYNANASQGNGIVNSAGQWASQVGGVGAQANRNAANQLFQQSLAHESAGLASLNIGMLSQALTESQQGVQADDQARHLAQTSLQALQTGQSAGHVDLLQYGVTEDQLRDLANNSSPLLPTVQSHLSGYGISVDHSAAVVKSPFGEFPLNAGAGDVTAAVSQIAKSMGYSSDDVASGVQAGLANASSIGQKALADAQAAAGMARNTASAGGAATTAKSDPEDAAKKAAAVPVAEPSADKKPVLNLGGSMSTDEDLKARMAALQKNRAQILKGLPPTNFADASSNLFLLVHDRYVEMDREGSFNHDQKLAANPSHR